MRRELAEGAMAPSGAPRRWHGLRWPGKRQGRTAATLALAAALCGRLLPEPLVLQPPPSDDGRQGALAFAAPKASLATPGAVTGPLWRLLPPRATSRHPPSRGNVAVASAWVVPNPLHLSGVWEALSSIFVSELGDKTFFLTMVLALRRGRALAMLSAIGALWLMTGISCTIGVVLSSFRNVQPFVNTTAALMMLFFGLQCVREGIRGAEDCEEGLEQAECEINSELKKAKPNTFWQFMRFAILIFLAEWGDRSMFMTVTLAASRSPAGVFVGGCAGHFGASALAVLSGRLLEQYVSDRVIKMVGGALFIGFGLTTLLGIY